MRPCGLQVCMCVQIQILQLCNCDCKVIGDKNPSPYKGNVLECVDEAVIAINLCKPVYFVMLM